jgi:O-antigen/teichoic acid export membrane protein
MAEPDLARRVLHGSAARAAGYVGGSLVTAVASIFLLRHLGIVDFGRYGTVMALLAIVSGLTEGGLTLTATRDFSLQKTPEGRRALLGEVLGLRIALSLLAVAAAVAFAVVAGYDSTLVTGTLFAGIGVLLTSVEAVLLVPLVTDLRNGRVAVNDLVRQALLAVGIVAFAVAGAGLGGFFVNQLIAGAALVLLAPLIVGRVNIIAPHLHRSRAWALLKEAAPVAVATVLGIVYFRILVILSSLLTGDEQTGRFVTSSRIIELLVGLPLLITGVVLPVMTVAARENPGRMVYVTQRLTELAALAGTLIALVLALGAEPILVLLGGEEYRQVAPVLRIQAPMMITMFLVSAWNPALIALNRQRAMAIATALGLSAAVAGGLALIPPFDANGAAAAASGAELVNAAAALVLLRVSGPGRELSFGWLPRMLLITAAAAAVGLAVPGGGWLPPIAAALVFCAGALVARLVPPEVGDALRRRSAAL